MIQHQKICESFKPKAKCPLCKKPNIKGLSKHLETACPKREVNCEKCTIKIIGDEEHDCVKELLILLDKVQGEYGFATRSERHLSLLSRKNSIQR